MRKCQVNDPPRKIQCQAAALEKALYCHQQKLKGGAKTAVTSDSEDTLDRRLHQLMESLLQRRRAKISQKMRDTTTDPDNHHRTAVLKQCLGAQQYQRLQSILEQVQQLGVARGCCCAAASDEAAASSSTAGSHASPVRSPSALFPHGPAPRCLPHSRRTAVAAAGLVVGRHAAAGRTAHCRLPGVVAAVRRQRKLLPAGAPALRRHHGCTARRWQKRKRRGAGRTVKMSMIVWRTRTKVNMVIHTNAAMTTTTTSVVRRSRTVA